MAFTREDLEAYEKGPQRQIDDKVSPFRGATPAKAADASAIAAVAAGQVDATPGGSAAAAASSPASTSNDGPVVDEEGTLGDPTGSGEGTSDDLTADPSTAPVDHGDEVDPNTDLTGEEPAPKKGSARERIVELNDLAEGYKLYGKHVSEENKALREQLAALSRQSPAAAAAAEPTAAVVEDDEPMPDMTDEDVQFDTDKYRAKMAKWVKSQVTAGAKAAVREVTGKESTQKTMQAVEQKVEAYKKDHADFDEVVTNNPVLAANQLGPDAAAIVGESEHTAEMLYRFGKDPKLAIQVARMNPRDQIRFVTRMEDQIAAEVKAGKTTPAPQGGAKPAPKKSVTQATPPPQPTRAAGRANNPDPTDSNMSMEEFARQHRASKQASRESARKLRGLA
jgi:hypothetical protein